MLVFWVCKGLSFWSMLFLVYFSSSKVFVMVRRGEVVYDVLFCFFFLG